MKKELKDLLTAFEGVAADINSDDAIAFIEDMNDSYTGEDRESAARIQELEARLHERDGELETWKKRYRDRFYGRDDETERNEYTETKDERPDGDTIKIKDIFSKKED